jgi:hypothetical protein
MVAQEQIWGPQLQKLPPHWTELHGWTSSLSSFSLVSLGGVRLSPLGTSATVGLLYQPRMIDDDYGAVGGMRIGRGNRSIRRKPASMPLCPPKIPHDLTWDRNRAAAVGSQQLTAWAMARPRSLSKVYFYTRQHENLGRFIHTPSGTQIPDPSARIIHILSDCDLHRHN